MTTHTQKTAPVRLFVLLLALALAGCEEATVQSGETTSPQQGAIPSVRVNASVAESARLARSGLVTGIVSAFRKATVSAEVPRRVVSRRVEPGDTVEVEQIMIELDNDRAVLSLRNTQAQAQAQRVDMDHAQHEFTRGKVLPSNA